MDFDFSPEQQAFAEEVERFLDENDDPDVFDLTRENMAQIVDTPKRRAFMASLGERGWLGMTWPKEHGGSEGEGVYEYLLNEALAEEGIEQLRECADTVIVIPNQNLFRIADAKTTFADAFAMADRVLYSGVGCITDLIVKEGLINLDFADVKSVMRDMGRAMMGTGQSSGTGRSIAAAEAAIANPLLDVASMKGAKGVLVHDIGDM